VLQDQVNNFQCRTKRAEQPKRVRPTLTTESDRFNAEPLDDFRQLSIIPDLHTILEVPSDFRKNIIDGVYEDARHYLDVSRVILINISHHSYRTIFNSFLDTFSSSTRRFYRSTTRRYSSLSIRFTCQ
jgi:hypothetical protein